MNPIGGEAEAGGGSIAICLKPIRKYFDAPNVRFPPIADIQISGFPRLLRWDSRSSRRRFRSVFQHPDRVKPFPGEIRP